MWHDWAARRLAADAHTRLSREIAALRRRSKAGGRVVTEEAEGSGASRPVSGDIGAYTSYDSATDLIGGLVAFPWDTEILHARQLSLSGRKITFLAGGKWLVMASFALQSDGNCSLRIRQRLNGVTFTPPSVYETFLGPQSKTPCLVGLVDVTPGVYLEHIFSSLDPVPVVTNHAGESLVILMEVK